MAERAGGQSGRLARKRHAQRREPGGPGTMVAVFCAEPGPPRMRWEKSAEAIVVGVHRWTA